MLLIFISETLHVMKKLNNIIESFYISSGSQAKQGKDDSVSLKNRSTSWEIKQIRSNTVELQVSLIIERNASGDNLSGEIKTAEYHVAQ